MKREKRQVVHNFPTVLPFKSVIRLQYNNRDKNTEISSVTVLS